MSYNVDSIDIISKSDDFGITQFELEQFFSGEEDDYLCEVFPEDVGDLAEDIASKNFPYSGESSGHNFETLKRLLAKFTGSAEMVVCWEGGDSYSGLRVRNGVVTEPAVMMALVPEPVAENSALNEDE